MFLCFSIYAGVRCSGMWGGVARQLAPPASHVCVVQIRHIAYAFGGVNGTRPGYVVLDYGDPQLFVSLCLLCL